MKLSDVIAQYLIYKKIDVVFGYQGGSITHMIDSFERAGIKYIQGYNEQGAGFAADAYARVSELGIGVAIATNGPGATNIITAIADAYCDSIPVLFFTGQVHTFAMKKSKEVRQESFQEIDIIPMVTPVTKYAVTVMKEEDAIYEIAKAIKISLEGRSGPVVIDLPVDIQGQDLEVGELQEYFASIENSFSLLVEEKISENDISNIISALEGAKRPVILAGGGIRAASAIDEFRQFVQKSNIPVVCSLMGLDAIAHDDDNFVGFIGTYGNRYANLTIQNADVILVLGSRLDGRQTGKRKDLFAVNAKIIHVDIDEAEIKHFIDKEFGVHINLKNFLQQLLGRNIMMDGAGLDSWHNQIAEWEEEFSNEEEFRDEVILNPNLLLKELGKKCIKDSIVCFDVGQNQMWSAQSFRVKGNGVRLLSSGGLGAMGFSLPAAIGAYYAEPQKRIYAVMGDGGLQMNIQELQLIGQYQLPICIIVMNNHALGLIRDIHEKYYEKRYIGSVYGFGMPALSYIGKAYNLDYYKVNCIEDLKKLPIDEENGVPLIVEVEFQEDTYVRPELLGNDGLDYQNPYKEYRFGK